MPPGDELLPGKEGNRLVGMGAEGLGIVGIPDESG
jgi:hypothetical protein